MGGEWAYDQKVERKQATAGDNGRDEKAEKLLKKVRQERFGRGQAQLGGS